MDIDPEARERLAAKMEARALDLGLNWREVALRAGLSYEIVRRLRTSSTSVRPLTLRKVDAGLGWEPGSIERILNGGEPVPLAEDDPAAAGEQLVGLDRFERAVAADPRLTDTEKAAAIQDHRKLIVEKLEELHIDPPPMFLRGGVRHLAGESGNASNDEARGA